MLATLRTVLDHPHSVAARRALARAWRAVDDPRAELIEKELEIYDKVEQFWTRSKPVRKLIKAHGAEWAGRVGELAQSYYFELGLVAHISIDGATFLQHAAEIVRTAPVIHVRLKGYVDVHRLAATPELAQMSTLDIEGPFLDDSAAEALASSPYVRKLRILELCRGAITTRGLEALACSENLRDVVYIELTGNPVDGELNRFEVRRIEGRYFYLTSRGLDRLDVAVRAAAFTDDPMNLVLWTPQLEEFAYEE